MSNEQFKFELYQKLEKNKPKIYEALRKIPNQIGVPEELLGKIGLLGGSGSPPPILNEAMVEGEKVSRKFMKISSLDQELRKVVKEYYGDNYDAVATSTCEGALWVTFDALFTPPLLGRGDKYRTRYIAPYERHLHHQGGYGYPFPPRYKDNFADRGATAGELGICGKRLENLDVIFVPLIGAKYPCHGIKYYPAVLLTSVNPQASYERITKVAKRHESYLTGFASLGYDTPGYGYGIKDKNGTPLLQKLLGDLSEEYGVPYVIDNARGTPFLGNDIRNTGADVMLYSADKAFPGPTSGLIIGKEEVMIPIRRALGTHGQRWGTSASHGKAGYVALDPGKENLSMLINILKLIRNQPERFTKPIDLTYKIVKEEFSNISQTFSEGFIISKSYNSLAVEINYENTWKNNQFGIPIFPIEDFYSSGNLLQYGFAQMGISPPLCYDGNIILSPFCGGVDDEGKIKEDVVRYMVKCLVRSLEILFEFSVKEG